MEHFAGLDVSVKQTSVCIVDGAGRLVREVRVASEPEALLAVLTNPLWRFKRIGLEAGPLSQWLFSAMKIARQRGIKKAIVALARRLAVIMHRIWVDGTEFRWTREQAAAAT